MEEVWKQLSLCEGKVEVMESRNVKADDKLSKLIQ